MGNLFGSIREMNSTLLEDIRNDPNCWTEGGSASLAYYCAYRTYNRAEDEDFGTMCAALYERSQATTPEKIKLYHEWIAYYMYGEHLTDEEMKYRQQLAKRMNE